MNFRLRLISGIMLLAAAAGSAVTACAGQVQTPSPHRETQAPKLIPLQAKMDVPVRKPFFLKTEQYDDTSVDLKAQSGALLDNSGQHQGQPQAQTLKASQFDLRAQNQINILANYNIEVLVDRSMSMRKRDCPQGLSRWQWCGNQAAALAKSLAPCVPSGLTVIPFATEYDVFEHATAPTIDFLFKSINLQLGTRLFEPLAERIDNYLAHRTATSKPLLIVVITDGIPVPRLEPALVRQELIDSSQNMNWQGEITVVFCQIGDDDRQGRPYLMDLDQNLTSEGARYQLVHTIFFDELEQKGLGPAIVSAISQYGGAQHSAMLRDYMDRQPRGSLSFQPDYRQTSDYDTATFRKTDRFVDHADIDMNGVRHFGNGRHFDLNRVSLDRALNLANMSAGGPGWSRF